MFYSSINISKLSFLHSTVILIISFTLCTAVWLYQGNSFIEDLSYHTKEFNYENKKAVVRYEMNHALNEISRHKNNILPSLKEKLKEYNKVGQSILDEFYSNSARFYSREEMNILLLSALRPIRFNNGRVYFFIIDQNGKTLLNSAFPQYENQVVTDFEDNRGRRFIEKIIETVKKEQQGFVDYLWTEPGNSQDAVTVKEKITYVSTFKPTNWIIGVGDYINSYTRDANENLIEKLEQRSFDEEGKLFCFDNDLRVVFGNIRDTGSASSTDRLKQTLNEIMKVGNRGDGGFIDYPGNDSKSGLKRKRLAFVRYIPAKNWYLCSSTLLPPTGNEMLAERQQYQQHLNNGLILIGSLFVIMWSLIIINSRNYTNRIRQNITILISQLKGFFKRGEPVLPDRFTLKDFGEISFSLNELMAGRLSYELDLKHAIKQFQQAVDSCPFAFMLFEKNTNCFHTTFMNDEAMSLLSLNESKMAIDQYGKGLEHLELRSPSSETVIGNEENPFTLACTGEEVRNRELTLSEIGSDTVRSVMVDAIPLFNEVHDISGILIFIQDVSERFTFEETLRHADKMNAIGQLVSGIAHDFNNLLGAISGFAELIQIKSKNDQIKKYAEKVMLSSENAIELISRLTAFSQKSTETVKSIDLHETILDVIEIIQGTAGDNITIDLELDADRAWVNGDSSNLHSCIFNMVLNSVQAMPQGGQIKVATSLTQLDSTYCSHSPFRLKPGQYVKVTITDNGVGMPQHVTRRIYEPFFTTRHEGKGTGLGLTMVYGTIQQHKGAIDVKSTLGKGTTFDIYLPLFEVAPVTEQPDEFTEGHGERIMVIDDEQYILDITQASLESLSYDPLCFNSGLVALSYFKENTSDINAILLDLVMPEISGRELFKLLKKVNPHVPIIIISGHGSSKDIQTMIDAGATSYLQKPYNRNLLGIMVKKAISDSIHLTHTLS